jgi:hypothetical protein
MAHTFCVLLIASVIAADHAQQKHGMTERRVCRLANQPHGTQRYRAIRREDEDALTQAVV